MTGIDLQRPGDHAYHIALLVARSCGISARSAQGYADDMRRWLKLSPAQATETAEGTVLNLAAARKAAFWSYFNPMAWAFYAVGAVIIPLAAVEYGWWQATVFAIVVGGVMAYQFYALLKWWRAAPALLALLPPAGTRVAVNATTLVAGNATIPYDQIRFAEISLRQHRGFGTIGWWEFHRFLDRVTITAGEKTIRLDATAISNGQSIIDTLCSRVPATAF